MAKKKNPAAVELGRLGGKKVRNQREAAQSRWDRMTPEERKAATEKMREARKRKRETNG